MTDKTLGIFQINTVDIGGGAATVAWNLFRIYREWGMKSWLFVGNKESNDENVVQFPKYDKRNLWQRLCYNLAEIPERHSEKVGSKVLSRRLRRLGRPLHFSERYLGHEDFEYLAPRNMFDLIPETPDIIHCHNLHGDYFDLRALPWISRRKPVVMTLHDAWLLSGHCAHSFGCERWQTGCGNCPDLTISPPIRKDATQYNWKRKKDIFTKSRLYLATPSQWLMSKVEKSILSTAIVDAKVIPNGVDTNIFHPFNKQEARKKLILPENATIILFAANGIRNNIWKDYQMMRSAIIRVSQHFKKNDLIFLALGENAPPEKIGSATIQFIPFQSDPARVASYYQAADIYLHAARVDTFPNTVLEALACGTPVVATAVGGIPEQISNKKTGFLIPPGDAGDMAEKIGLLIEDNKLCKDMGIRGFDTIQTQFSLVKQAKEYLNWYHKIMMPY